MRNINKFLAASLSAAMLTGFTACSDSSDIPDTTATTQVTSVTTIPTTVTTVPETTVETEPPEDLTSIPDTTELISNIASNLNAAESFEISCNLKGSIPEKGSAYGKMIEHSFTYTIAGNNSHLKSKTTDLDADDGTVEYEEYQKLEDNIITTITKYEDNWVDNTPKEMTRLNMTTKALYSIGLVELIASNGDTTEDIFVNASVERDETGNYIITLPDWYTWTTEDDDFLEHGFTGLLRAPHLTDNLYNLSVTDPEGSITYIADKNFNLISITFDIIMPQSGSYDLICEIKFKDWNDIASINVPRPAKITNEDPEETSAETAATVAETTKTE